MTFDFDLQTAFNTFVGSPEWQGVLRLIVAGVLGVLVGWERELEGKPAGVRTYGAVAIGAAAFTYIGILAYGPGDPGGRLAAQIITGIGFLGAGTIIRAQGQVIGLTTAAGMWVIAAIGMAIGAGLFILGAGGALAIFVLLRFVYPPRDEGRQVGRLSPGDGEETQA
jgi:putative Mg2+ transporter-C (MgtC) family protein